MDGRLCEADEEPELLVDHPRGRMLGVHHRDHTSRPAVVRRMVLPNGQGAPDQHTAPPVAPFGAAEELAPIGLVQCIANLPSTLAYGHSGC